MIRRWLIVCVVAAIALYMAWFFSLPLPSPDPQTAPARWQLGVYLLLLPDEMWFGTPPEFEVLDRLPVLGLAGVIMVTAAAAGWLAMVLLRAERGLDRLETVVFATAAGLNLLSTYTLAVGLAGLLHYRAVFLVPGGVVLALSAWLLYLRGVFGRKANREAATRPAARKKKAASETSTPFAEREALNPHWLWAAAPFLALIVLGGMLPPNEFDVREYHLEAPKEFYQAGRLGFVPHNLYANMALGSEMHALTAMTLAGDWWLGALAGKTVLAMFAPLAALGLYAAGRRHVSRAAGVAAAVLYISTPWIVHVSTVGFVEGAFACYLFLALYAAVLSRRELAASEAEDSCTATPRLALAGYLGGAAVATKYPGVLFVALPLTVWIAGVLARRWRTAWQPLGVFALAGIAGCGLWFAKNWVLAGNPTYPLGYGLFGGLTWSAEKAAMWNRVHVPTDFSLWTLATDVVRVLAGSEWLSPVVLPLAMLGFAVRGARRLTAGLWLYFAFIVTAWWIAALRIDRYWISALILLALAGGMGAIWERSRAWRWSLGAVLVVGLVYNFCAANIALVYKPLFVSLARLRTDPARVNPWHRWFNAHAQGGRVLLVGEAQVFDLEMPILYNTWLDDSIFASIARDPQTGGLRPVDEIAAELHDRGITHVYVAWSEIGRYRNTGYGRHEFVTPDVFDRLVAAGVLAPLPPIDEHPGRAYQVVGAPLSGT